jgi:response regulator RpfG family c-di-GMP phosphodiesterase
VVRRRTTDLETAHLETLERLATIAEFRDAETAAHVERVGNLSARVASLLGCDPALVAQLRLAARLHDIGKISIPDAILYSRQKLLPEQWKIIRAHAFIGAQILSGSSSKLLNLAEEIALTHHEHWDGSGYPRGLKGEDIPLVGRIVAVVDVFDALISERPYKPAWTHQDALEEIQALAGSKFDPNVVSAFLEVIRAMNVEQSITTHQPRAYA